MLSYHKIYQLTFPAQFDVPIIFYFDRFPIYFHFQTPYLHTPTAGTYLEFPLRLTSSKHLQSFLRCNNESIFQQ